MFNLQTGIHLQKIKILASTDNKLHCSGRTVVNCTRKCHRLGAHRGPCFRRNERARGFFDYLLMAALDRTFAFADIDNIAVLVCHQLNFDMARLNHKFLDENARISKGCLRLAHGGAHAICQIGRGFDHPHALAAATRRRLDHHREANFLGSFQRRIDVFNRARRAGHNRHTNLFRKRL